jgi:hypothetical protein
LDDCKEIIIKETTSVCHSFFSLFNLCYYRLLPHVHRKDNNDVAILRTHSWQTTVDQKGIVKGRTINEVNRLIHDIIDYIDMLENRDLTK